MHPINQHSRLSAFAAKILLLTFLSWILIFPVPAGLSDSPKHSPQYEQLQSSIAALSAEIASIASTIDTLKDIQGRTLKQPPHQSHHLQTTIQGLTEKVATLQTQVQGLGGNVTHLTATVDALALTIKGDTPATGVTQTISKLQDNITKLEGKVDSLSPNQDSHMGLSEVMLSGLGASVITLIGRWLFIDLPTEKKRRAKERLEKFYAPVLGRLQANQDIWKNFKDKSGILTQEERDRIKRENAPQRPENGTQTHEESDPETPENIVRDILQYEARRPARLNIWVTAMEGIFRQNNEAAEKTILENYGYLRPEDVDEDSNFYKERKNYLMHVGEFKAVLHRWEQARKDTLYQKDTNWYDRCRRSSGLDIDKNPSAEPSEKQFLNYFHPTNPYQKEFLKQVQKSYDALMDEAGLAEKGWFGRPFDRFQNRRSAQTKKEG
ncbi:hypothetical protein [Nitrospira defluvii]|uniref:Chromosome partition protein Smc n=1 Tax=Nitrospira defluvii TaxID=330214 RepID=A0ABM8RCP6_9BACT|nr:hypothetical protein [Nitrospira defluvii]CAE6745908.1 hypothetical protein NSPZN2_20007 [Nitrospira defluvii]